jgi:predicted nucleic acid-binding protein
MRVIRCKTVAARAASVDRRGAAVAGTIRTIAYRIKAPVSTVDTRPLSAYSPPPFMPSAASAAEPPAAAPIVVLDTNVVLDWLLFSDPRCRALAAAIESGALRWIASPPMRAELDHVLARGIPSARAGHPDRVREGWERWSIAVEADDRPSPPALRCTDADDQKFIDLALQFRAAALLSRDRAVLKLARRAAGLGLAIRCGAGWPKSG